jgi:amino acid transporter
LTGREQRNPEVARARDQIIQQDVEDLRRLGYGQQLFREMGGFSNFAISFSIISVLTGAILLFGYGLKFAGPVINSVGWPVVSLFTLCVAASMAELASAYPTAGGLYFWAFRLGGRGWAWVTAWLNMIGQVRSILITSMLAIAICLYAAAYFVVTSISTITLYLAYAIPIFLNWRNRGTDREHTTPATAPWSLGRWGAAINVVALLWVLALTVIFSLPPNELVLWTMLLVAILLAVCWWVSARRHFRGPAASAQAS